MLCAGFWVGNPVLITQATPRLLGGQKNATLNFCSTTLAKCPESGTWRWVFFSFDFLLALLIDEKVRIKSAWH